MTYHELRKVRTDPHLPSLVMDSVDLKRFRGSGDSFLAPGVALGEMALTAAECDLRATQKRELFVLVEHLTSSTS